MTLRHMRILVAVFQQGSVTKAAQALHLAQPSVSLALRELEDYYGVALFTRTGRQLLPTVCGQSFYDYAVHVVSLVDEMETQMRNWDTLGTMRIGSTNKIDEVDRDDFLALAKELDVSPRMVRRLIEEVCEGIGGAASDVLRDTEDALGAPLSKLGDIEVFARSQIDRLGIKRS